jgi:1-acyl-sn-glycerol-3-phosphate acyltransferase
MFYRVCWWIGYLLCKVLFRLRAFDVERVPTSGPVILAGNHCSYADPVFIGVAAVRDLHFLAKREAFDWFFFGPLIRRLNALPVTRGGVDLRALSAVEGVLGREGAVLMFPEGTRHRDGRLGQARPGVGFVAVRTQAPIVPLHISGTARIFGTLLGLRRVVVRFGSPVFPADFPLSDNHRETYQKITDEVMRRIAELKEQAEGNRRKA